MAVVQIEVMASRGDSCDLEVDGVREELAGCIENRLASSQRLCTKQRIIDPRDN
jgi:hypothetical protein